ncbi:MAG: glycosyltransferase [Bacilli bacterium]|jgi:glycosyltransferase involved in cell wall biosynthesis|nr:glycosyltransferase [Bacilli bacterium]
MTIVFVLDCANVLTNGTAATALRFATELRKRGHTVRMLGAESEEHKDDPDYFGTKHYSLPVFQFLVEKQGFCFASINEKKMYEAIKGADVVHLFLPFPFESKARLIAQSLNIPVTAAFHLQPENVTYTIYLGKNKGVNSLFYRYFYDYFYRYVRHIHCPSQMIADQLKKHHYNNNILHVISNGVSDYFHPIYVEKPEALKNKFVILMIGRLSREKRQDLIIKAISTSKYNKDIQLILCGQGPNKDKLEKTAFKSGLVNPPIMSFCSQEELRKIINYSDLYVHSSDAEIEGIACIEAFSCGLVPIIADSVLSATNQFALDPHCLFRAGKFASLREKIEYFLEHPAEKEALSKKYMVYASDFRLDRQVSRMEEMFMTAIEEKKEGLDLPLTNPSHADQVRMEKMRKKLLKQLNSDLVRELACQQDEEAKKEPEAK